MYEIIIKNALSSFLKKDDIKLSIPPDGFSGDLSTNAAMAAKTDPEKISAVLQELDCIESIETVGPGFINITVKMDALREEVKEIYDNPEGYGKLGDFGKIIFEMVSSNPTGPLHIGHGRGGAIGDTLARIYKKSVMKFIKNTM